LHVDDGRKLAPSPEEIALPFEECEVILVKDGGRLIRKANDDEGPSVGLGDDLPHAIKHSRRSVRRRRRLSRASARDDSSGFAKRKSPETRVIEHHWFFGRDDDADSPKIGAETLGTRPGDPVPARTIVRK